MKPWQHDWTAVHVLWRHDLAQLLRRPAWILSALIPAVAVWLLLGLVAGPEPSMANNGLGQAELLFPGALILVLLQASLIAGGGTVRPDRPGLTRFLLAGPASTGAVVLGKCLAAASAALAPSLAFVLLAPLAGFDLSAAQWPLLLTVLALSALGLSAASLALRWLTASRVRHLAITFLVLLPLWLLSGAAQPPGHAHPLLGPVLSLNPIAYGVSATRHALYGAAAPSVTVVSGSPGLELGILAGFCVAALAGAIMVFRRRDG